MEKIEVELRNGTKIIGDKFDYNDFLILKKIFREWIEINKKLKSLGGRNLIVPDVFSEALFCYLFKCVRTNGTAYSYDCVSLENSAGIQIKSASISNDCTSFGPKSTWDELYFVDFASNGCVDGIVEFYKIDVNFENLILNAKKGETFKDQQLQGRRPRFSIKSQIIKPYEIKPFVIINLLEDYE